MMSINIKQKEENINLHHTSSSKTVNIQKTLRVMCAVFCRKILHLYLYTVPCI